MIDKKKLLKEKNGITLVALVITVIVLLILAGITLNLTLGENGLLKRAQQGENAHKLGEANDINKLDQATDYMNRYINGEIAKELPENTPTTEAGTEVKSPEEWYSTTSAYVSTEDGREVTKMVKVATVTAVATGNGETVPVPKGFYYVGGTINTGVVISDSPLDQNKYVNYTPSGEVKEGIPTGVTYNEDGTVKTYTEEEYKKLSVEEQKAVLMGNQFVWIPCEAKDYTKKVWGKNANGGDPWEGTWEKQTNGIELPQIQKYGGFYVGRYEAGTSNISLSTGVNFAGQNTASNWTNDKFSIRDGLNHTIKGKITLKAGEIPYYYTDYYTALKLSNSMYQTENVQSALVTGTMWDVMLKFIAGSDDNVVTKGSWGNFEEDSVTYTEGKGRFNEVDSSGGGVKTPFTKCDGIYHYGIKTTAISEEVKKKNLYDIAGNLSEWTDEAGYVDGTERYVLRGASFYDSYAQRPPCIRAGNDRNYNRVSFGFRPALFIK